ncbi:unnamed protein product [Symbiodinium sp. CCMP2592]|nr:unnamed protein product [Symbiodinium sp. CCMP2592]
MQLNAQTFDILCVQETYWREDRQWSDAGWTYIHHGSGQNKEAGLLVCVAKTFAPETAIRHTPTVPGRLQHIRIFPSKGHQPLDVLHVYQYAWYHRKRDNPGDWWADCLNRRAGFLHKLSSALKGIPQRNVLCVLGDLNTQLLPKGGVVGTGVPPSPGPHLDVPELTNTLETFGLLALNTFGPSPGSTFINESNGTQSQIDYIIARSAHSDKTSRQAATIADWPVGAARLGMKHLPLQGSLPLNWCPWNLTARRPPAVRPHKVVAELGANPALQATFEAHLRAILPPNASIQDIDRTLQDVWLQLCPATAGNKQSRDKNEQAGAPQLHTAPRIWELRAEKRRLAEDTSLHGQLAHWRTSVRLSELERAAGAARRHRKRQFLLDQVEQAETAAGKGHLSKVYAVVRRLAPKKVNLRLHVRTPEGHMQGPQAERETLLAHFRDLYRAPEAQPHRVLPCQEPLFTPAGCTTALARLPAQKAAHPKAAPGILWKLGATTLGPMLSRILNDSYAEVPWRLPIELRQVALCLVPKPGRRAQQPADARPISLIHPANKAHASMLNELLAPFLLPYLASSPQFAYCHGRSTAEALHRVYSHFFAVRAKAPVRARMVQRRQDRTVQHPCTGGISFSLDVAQAFDSIPRWVIVAALRAAGAPEDMITQIVTLHAQIVLEIDHGGDVATCHTARGVRQGCPLSPSLWAAATTFVYHRLLEALGPDASQVITMFADDVIGQWRITSPEALQDGLEQIRRMVRVLQHHGFRVSPTKSVILLQVDGPKASQILGKLRFREQGQPRLRLATDLSFPIVRRHTYLGMIIGYGAFEHHSVAYRCKRATQVFARLRQVLCGRHSLSMHNRIRLWRAIVWPSLRYGLSTLPLEPKSLQRVQGVAARQLRIITHSLGHETHKTNLELFAELRFHPESLLRAEAQANKDRFEALSEALQLERTRQWHHLLLASLARSPDEPVHSQPQPPPANETSADTEQATQAPPVPVNRTHFSGQSRKLSPARVPAKLVEVGEVTRPFACPDCPCTFATAATLQTHRAQKHGAIKRGTVRRATQQQNQVEHSLGGVHFRAKHKTLHSRLEQTEAAAKGIAVQLRMTATEMEQEDSQEWELYSRFMANQPAPKLSRPLPSASENDQTPDKGRGKKQLTKDEQQELLDLRQLCEQLIRLAMRHEDSIKALQLDTSFVLWLRVGLPGGLPESLHQAAETWRTDRDQGLARTSLRHHLWLHLWKEFQRRLTPALLTAEIQSLMTKLGYLKDGHWAFLRWEANEETGGRLIPDTEKKSLNMQEVRESVDHIVRLSQDAELITRFCPTRPLAAELKGQSITFLCSIANRSAPSHQLHAALQTLCSNASCQVLGMAIKPERLARSPLANALARQLPAAQSRTQQLLKHSRKAPGLQHDAAEFLKSFQVGANMNALSGVWQARTTEGEVRYLGDTSPLPLSVPLVAGATVQELVNSWTAQAQVHALWHPPECIALQLSRYGPHGKLHTLLRLDDEVVQIPSFVASDTRVCNVAYKLQAVAVHLGNTPTEGHYRAALLDEGNKLWYADDGKPATLANAKIRHEIQANCYVLYLTRV